MRRWRHLRIACAISARYAEAGLRCGRSKHRPGYGSGAKPLRRPGIEAAGNRALVAAALGRDVQPDDVGIADQRGKIRRFEEQPRVRREPRKTTSSAARGAARRSGGRARSAPPAHRSQTRISDSRLDPPRKLAQRESQAVAQRQPVRRQFILLASGAANAADDGVVRRQIEHGIAELARPLPRRNRALPDQSRPA